MPDASGFCAAQGLYAEYRQNQLDAYLLFKKMLRLKFFPGKRANGQRAQPIYLKLFEGDDNTIIAKLIQFRGGEVWQQPSA
jgi:hypothetical protein